MVTRRAWLMSVKARLVIPDRAKAWAMPCPIPWKLLVSWNFDEEEGDEYQMQRQ